jgi:hypothetical protein
MTTFCILVGVQLMPPKTAHSSAGDLAAVASSAANLKKGKWKETCGATVKNFSLLLPA